MTIEFDGQNNKLGTTTANSVTIKTNDTDAITVDSSQNVGIGTSSPQSELHVNSSANADIRLTNDTVGTGVSDGLTITMATNSLASINQRENAPLLFYTNSTEAMRIDSSGNLLVGTTNPTPSINGVEGIALSAGLYGGRLEACRDGNAPVSFGRLTSDGVILDFSKDGSSVGSIGCGSNSRLIINGDTNGIAFERAGTEEIRIGNNVLQPSDDNDCDLGLITRRFDDVYATNGTIQTSDQNEKQSIQSLTASEIAVAQRISKLFKTFKWNSAVEEKGDNARTHTGIIAQDVQQAFADEGLDASNYALFISSTWWEKEISVDAVAPQEAVYETQTDEEGNEIQVLVQEAVEGKDAYTYIDTKDEATEGYTERTRLGIRYPELLSFVSSAFEQRLTNIETRLEALENV